MEKPRIVEFQPWHLELFKNRETGVADDPRLADVTLGPAYTAIIDGKAIGCGGIALRLPKGVGVPWLALSEDIAPHMKWLIHVLRQLLGEIINEHQIAQLESGVDANKDRNRRFIESFGFVPEGDYTRYVFRCHK